MKSYLNYNHEYGLWKFGNGTGTYRPESGARTETRIVADSMCAVKTKYKCDNVFVTKIHGGAYQQSGLPDLYIALCGASIWIEMKRPGADTTALQVDKLKQLKDAGVFCGTAESPERVIEIIESVKNVCKLRNI